MASNDYAIVIGINNYPGITDIPLHGHDLLGPVNDATAIYAWLTDDAKGAVPVANAQLIRSPSPLPAGFGVATAEPVAATIVNAFTALATLGQQKPPPLGRRLYVYMSGHGFAPERAKGAVFAADATDISTQHVFATAWLEWFYYAGHFTELVLWLDCCMTYHFTVVPMPPSLRRVVGNAAATGVFSAYSAKFGQQSAEGLMPDGLVHGAFTYTLLQALDSAVDVNGDITTASIKQYLINRMRSNVPSTFKQMSSVAQEPDFGFDQPMVFVQSANISNVVVDLSMFIDGAAVDILGGIPYAIVASTVVRRGVASLPLRPGVYMARSGAIQHGFTV